MAAAVPLVLGLPVLAVVTLMSRARLDLYEDRVVLVSTFGTHKLPLSEIVEVGGVAGSGGPGLFRVLALKTASGKVYSSLAVTGKQPMYRDPAFETKVAEVRAAVDELRGSPTVRPEPVGRH